MAPPPPAPAPTPTPTPTPTVTPAPPRPEPPFLIKEKGILFQDNFEDGVADGWGLKKGWEVAWEDGNYVLRGQGADAVAFPLASIAGSWSDYTVEAEVKVAGGQVMFNFRQTQGPPGSWGNSYFFDIQPGGGMGLRKHIDHDFFDLTPPIASNLERDKWHKVKVVLKGNNSKVYLDDELKIDYIDDDLPIRMGGLFFNTPPPIPDSLVYLDNIKVTGVKVVQRSRWVKTGGPPGGLGYDVRIHPQDKNIMFVTDNPSGVNKSHDAGANWVAKNEGITSRAGPSFDGIPVFCLTIDPNDPSVVWAGTQFMRGIYKSTDGGETWTKKDNGVTEWDDITFRGFAIRPGNSNIVFAAAEIHTGIQGSQFEKVKGKIYKTEDGGENWRCVWEGTSLARFVIINPQDPDIIYASTGIFDREAYNDAPVGVLKSTDGGETWRQINNGIDNLFVGFLEMHPTNPAILFAAAGNCTVKPPGSETGAIYRTTDGGERWEKVLGRDRFSVVTLSPSNPKVIYPAGCEAFFRSDDGGDSWKRFTKGRVFWGPPGMKSGQPIGIVAAPNDPMTVYVNNYTGGVFKSNDGGETWVDWSHGYTGADMYTVAIYPTNSNIVYAGSRSGPFRSYDGGRTWDGILYPHFPGFAEVPAIAVNPQNPREVLASDAQFGYIFSSSDGADSWQETYHHPKAPKKDAPAGNDPRNWYRFTCIAYAPSNPMIVYAGIRKAGPHMTEIYYEPSFGIVKSSDGGNTWKEINSGLESSKKNINCIAVHPQNPDIAYAGTLQDGVYKTTDGGNHWVPMNNGLMSLDVRFLAIDPQSRETVYAGLGEGAGLYKTTNGGELWVGVNYGIRVECPSYLQRVGEVRPGVSLVKPKRLVGGDYVSVPWTVITGIAIDPEEPQTVYVADYFLGVYLSTNGGLSWDTINEGLSTKAVTALALSADGWVLYAATSGEGVFRLELW